MYAVQIVRPFMSIDKVYDIWCFMPKLYTYQFYYQNPHSSELTGRISYPLLMS